MNPAVQSGLVKLGMAIVILGTWYIGAWGIIVDEIVAGITGRPSTAPPGGGGFGGGSSSGGGGGSASFSIGSPPTPSSPNRTAPRTASIL